MNDSDESDIPGAGANDEVDALDTFLDHLLAGADPAADAPAWSHDVALLVRTARAPAQPGELAGEADIVARMAEVRRTAAATTTADHATAGAGVVATVTRLADRRGRDDSDRHYRAKHAAARLEASRHPAIRTVGRVLALKAAAVTTVAVVGVAAAAAATTGIVATVVVPALTDAPPEPKPVPTTEGRRRSPTTAGTRGAAPADGREPAVCPMVPTCTAPPATVAAPTTTVVTAPTTPTTEAASDDGTPSSTSTTVATTSTSTTVATQTTVEPTTTTTSTPGSGPDPGPSTLADDGGGDGGEGGGSGAP